MFNLDLLDILAFGYFILGVRTVILAWRERRSLTDDTLTPQDRYLLGQLAFFVLVPPGVLLHELAHAIATLQVGGQVVGFHFALFYGYVIPRGNFTPLEEWWIALSGNLVSIAYGLLAIPLIPRVRAAWSKYLLLSFARVQLGWALVGYPLLTLVGFGDWRVIYDPQTWVVGIPFAVFHLALIAVLFFVNRSARLRLWEASLFPETDERLQTVRNTLAQPPQDTAAQIERGIVFGESNLPDLARSDFLAVLKNNPRDPHALHYLAQIEYDERNIPAARRHFQESLAVSTNDARLSAENHYFLGRIFAEEGKFNAAIDEYNQSVQRSPEIPNYYYWRAMAWRALRDKNRAGNDFLKSAELFEPTHPKLAEHARQMAFEEH
jgi:tetratricopeptide (TPR) repeat protein